MIAIVRKPGSGSAASGAPGSPPEEGTRSLGRMLIVLALALAAAAGGLLWWERGAAVFSELMLAGLAWCL